MAMCATGALVHRVCVPNSEVELKYPYNARVCRGAMIKGTS